MFFTAKTAEYFLGPEKEWISLWPEKERIHANA